VSVFSEDTDSTFHFNALYVRKGLLLSQRSNATMYSYRDTANFLTKKKKKQKDSTKYKQNKYQC
jgi:hypothetical protein